MGARHIAAVYASWSDLPDQAFRLLTYMALVVPDAHTVPIFWRGRRDLAFGVGRPVEDGKPMPPATSQVVKRTLRTLTQAGAITLVYGGWRGKNAEYRLNLTPTGKGVTDRTPLAPQDEAERGSLSDRERGSLTDPKGGHLVNERGSRNVPPRSTEETEERQGGNKLTSPSHSPRAHEPDDAQPEMDQFEAQRILSEATRQGVNVVALMKSAPADCTTKGQRRIWAARQIIAEEAS